MKITDIKQQVRRQGRYSIYADDVYVFSLSENELLSSGIRISSEYSKEEFEQLKKTAVLDKAYMRCLDLLARRTRSRWEIENYLSRKDYDISVINETLTHLEEKGYINDERFARAWVDSRRLLKSVSRRRLTQELRQKRVADDVIRRVLELDETDDGQVIRELVDRKRHQTRYQDDTKLTQYLLRQGFNYDDVKKALYSSD